jgi:hypothetical protein
LCSHSTVFQHCMRLGGSLPCSQELSTCPYPDPDQFSPYNPMLSTHLRIGLAGGHVPPGFPTNNLYALRLSPIHAKCPTHLIPLDLLILVMLCEEYKSCNSSLCSFFHLPVTSFLCGPNILLSTLSQTPSVYVPPLKSETKFHAHTQVLTKLWSHTVRLPYLLNY